MDNLQYTFDSNASTYDKYRPTYPDKLYQKIFSYTYIDENSRVLEIGSGSGQATSPMLNKGYNFIAIEIGKEFCKLLKEKYKDNNKFNVINCKFEDVELENNSFDLIYSASAFHWLEDKFAYEKVYNLLKEKAVFARFSNNPYPSKDNIPFANALSDIYARYYYKYYVIEPKGYNEFSEEACKNRALLASKYGYKDIEYHMFYRVRCFKAKEYIKLLSTYSDHIAIEETIRNAFFKSIEETINIHGGSINIFDTIDLQLARK